MLSDYILFKALLPASGGGGSGGGLTAMTAIRNSEDWSEYPNMEAFSMVRLFDTVPTFEQLCNAKLIGEWGTPGFQDTFDIKRLYPQGDDENDGVIMEDGCIFGYYRGDTLFLALPTDEVAEMLGATKGIWFLADALKDQCDSYYKSVTLMYE